MVYLGMNSLHAKLSAFGVNCRRNASDVTVESEKKCDYTVERSTETREMSKTQWNHVGSYHCFDRKI